jgi:hypothetical protein
MTMYVWSQIISNLVQSGPSSVARVPTRQMQHPRDAGITQTFAAPYGQRASYRAMLTDGSTLCIEEFGEVYEARLEGPLPAPVATTVPRSASVETVAGLTALGALLGLAFGGRKESVLTGALLGGVSGLATIAVAEAGRSPETSKTALELAKMVSALVPAASSPSKSRLRQLAGSAVRGQPSGARKTRSS